MLNNILNKALVRGVKRGIGVRGGGPLDSHEEIGWWLVLVWVELLNP